MIRGYAFNSSADFETVREIKEKLCYASIDPAKERKIAQDTTVINTEFKLPNGETIMLGRERFEAPELLMDPSKLEMEEQGLPGMIFDSITSCDINLRKALASSIYLSGGTTMTPGLSSRLEKELKNMWV